MNGKAAVEAEAFLSKIQVPDLLADFVAACVVERPENAVAFMARWSSARCSAIAQCPRKLSITPDESQRRSPENMRPQSSRRTSGSSEIRSPESGVYYWAPSNSGPQTAPDKFPIGVILSSKSSSSGQLWTLLKASTQVSRPSTEASMAHAAVSAKLREVKADDATVTVLHDPALGIPLTVFVDSHVDELNDELLKTTSVANTAVIPVAAPVGIDDMKKKREGELYNRAMLAHALGLRRALVCVCDSSEPVSEIEKEIVRMLGKCGFGEESYKIIFFPVVSETICTTISSLPNYGRIKYCPEPAHGFTATTMVLNGDAVTAGQTFSAFSSSPMNITVSHVDNKNKKSIPVGDVGSIQFQVCGSATASVAVGGPVVCYKNGKVLAMGNIVHVESLEVHFSSDEETEESGKGDSDFSLA